MAGNVQTVSDWLTISQTVLAAMMLIATGLYVWLTSRMVRANEFLVGPQVIVTVEDDTPRTGCYCLVIQNCGSGAARNVMLRFDPDINYRNSSTKLSQLSIFKHPFSLVPRQCIRFVVVDEASLAGDGSDAVDNLRVRVVYENVRGRQVRSDFAINIRSLREIRDRRMPALEDIADQLRLTNQLLEKMTETKGEKRRTSSPDD